MVDREHSCVHGDAWWATVLLAAVVIRIALIRPYIAAADTSARLAAIKDTLTPIQARIQAARSKRDQQELIIAVNEVKTVYRNAGIALWKVGIPFIQVPIGFGSFRLFRGMSNLPVPGLEEGGFWWLQDLTVADPYLITPLICAVAAHATFRVSSCA